jgi:hypothetical protein
VRGGGAPTTFAVTTVGPAGERMSPETENKKQRLTMKERGVERDAEGGRGGESEEGERGGRGGESEEGEVGRARRERWGGQKRWEERCGCGETMLAFKSLSLSMFAYSHGT